MLLEGAGFGQESLGHGQMLVWTRHCTTTKQLAQVTLTHTHNNECMNSVSHISTRFSISIKTANLWIWGMLSSAGGVTVRPRPAVGLAARGEAGAGPNTLLGEDTRHALCHAPTKGGTQRSSSLPLGTLLRGLWVHFGGSSGRSNSSMASGKARAAAGQQ